jgi:hypothetical protein
MQKKLKKTISFVMVLHLLSLCAPQFAGAVLIETGVAAGLAERGRAVNEIFARQDVRETLIAYGVDPENASRRVAALSDDELNRLEAGIAALPAGGDSVLAVLGIVFVVLIVLEIVGVTDIYKKV